MRIIGVLNHKGGTGKTTTAVNLAGGLAKIGAKVLCIDLDAQGSLATSLGTKYSHSLTDFLLGRESLASCIQPARKNLDLIPSDASLLQVEGSLWRLGDSDQARQSLLNKLQGIQGYDYIVLDYSPSVSLLSQGGLLYIRELIVPVAMNYMAMVGSRQVIQTLKEIGRWQHQLSRLTILPTFYYGRLRKDREILKTLNRYFKGQIAEPIRNNVKLAEAPGHHQNIFEYAPHSYGAQDYMRLVERTAQYGS